MWDYWNVDRGVSPKKAGNDWAFGAKRVLATWKRRNTKWATTDPAADFERGA